MFLFLLPSAISFAFFIDYFKVYRPVLALSIIISPLIRIARIFLPEFLHFDLIANLNMIFGESLFDYFAAIYLIKKGQLDQILPCYSARAAFKLLNILIEERKDYLLFVICFILLSCLVSLVLLMIRFSIEQKRERRRFQYLYNLNYIFLIAVGITTRIVDSSLCDYRNIYYFLTQVFASALLYYFKMSMNVNFLLLLSFYGKILSFFFHKTVHIAILNGITSILLYYSIFILSFRTKYISYFRYCSFYLIYCFLPVQYFSVEKNQMNCLYGNVFNGICLFIFYLLEKLK